MTDAELGNDNNTHVARWPKPSQPLTQNTSI